MGNHFRARRGLRALVVGTVVSLAFVGASAGTAGAATNTQRAQRGAQWLANQIHHNGGFLENFGSVDVTDTAYAVIGMRAAGIDRGASSGAVAYLKTKIGAKVQSGGQDAPGALAEYIMAAVATGQNPRTFGGSAAKNNLVKRLLATERTTGADAGLFGAQDPTYDGAFREGLALSALAAVHIPKTDPRIVSAISWLTKQQCSNGLWESYRSDTSVACPPSDPNAFTGPDTNSTGFAVQGLGAWGKHPGQAALLHSLDAVQSSDGGFPYIASAHQASDPNSTALVIQALLVENSSPNAPMWKKGKHTPYTALGSYQLSCKSKDFGAFVFPGSPDANIFATVQAIPALVGKKLPITPTTKSKTISLKRC